MMRLHPENIPARGRCSSKKQHVGVIPGIQEFVTEFVNAGTRDGYLVKAGLIASPDATRASMAEAAKNMPLLTKDALK
jgi:phosphate transport system substrate-binding protein